MPRAWASCWDSPSTARSIYLTQIQGYDALQIGENSVVADLGAGGGWFTVRLARRAIGPNGKVYAEDIQPQMIESIQRRSIREGLRNVQTLLGTEANLVDPP